MFVWHQQEKCHQYWPAERSARYQYFVVDPMAEYNMPQYILREFKVTDARVSPAFPKVRYKLLHTGVAVAPTLSYHRVRAQGGGDYFAGVGDSRLHMNRNKRVACGAPPADFLIPSKACGR